MASVLSLTVVDQPPWRRRLLGEAFRQPPWHDLHPDRLAIGRDLPPALLALAGAIDRFVDRLDLAGLVASFKGRGSAAHRPDLMLKAALFFLHRGLHSPADWSLHCGDSQAARWLLRGLRPSRARWYAFRRRCSALIDPLNRQLLRRAVAEGLLGVDVAILDGTFLAANSSRHVLLNHDSLRERLRHLDQAAAADQAATPAQAQAPPAGPAGPATAAGAPGRAAKPPGWMARTPRGRRRQLGRYQRALRGLGERLEQNRKRRKEDRREEGQVRVSPGDPEAALGLDKQRVYRPLYNVQLCSDLATDFCLGYGAYPGTQDAAALWPMLDRVEYFTGEKVKRAVVDAGYATGANLRQAERGQVELIAPYRENDYSRKKGKGKKQIGKSEFRWDEGRQTYVCPEGRELRYVRTQTKRRGGSQERHRQYRCPGEYCQRCPRQQECARNPRAGRMVVRGEYEEEVHRHKQRMSSEQAKALYKRRKEQVERRIADSKEHRDLRRLSMRGQDGARTQVGLTVLAANIVVFDKLQRAAEQKRDKVSTLPTFLL